jgi:hypothetical protein
MRIRQTVATHARAAALAVLLGIAPSSVLVPLAHAESKGGVTPNKPCYIPGSNLPYVTGEKATFSVNGGTAKEYTCQKDGTWTASVAVGTWTAYTVSFHTGVFAP